MYDNIGYPYFDRNVEAAGEAVAGGALGAEERVVVFHRSYREVPDVTGARSVIYELVKDSSREEGFRRELLRVYEPGENALLSKETVANVAGDIRTAIPGNHYGLAFGSHGRGWIPKSYTGSFSRSGSEHPLAELWTIPENPLTRDLAYSSRERIDIGEFVDALDEWNWDFILLDDCFMASVEALYQMRTLADYFIASPTEIMITGFPYDRVVSTLFTEWENNIETALADVAGGFVESYRAGEMHEIRCATVAVVKSSEMDALAEAVRRLNLRVDEVTSTTGIQYYEGYTRPGHAFYDLDDYLSRIRAGSAEYGAFTVQLARTVLFSDHTDTFYTDATFNRGEIYITRFSGLNVFIPWSGMSVLIPDYRQTEWYRDVYAE
jgi:hypothetical protein